MKPPRLNPGSLTRLRPAKINFYLRFMRQQGFSSAQVLQGTGLTAQQLAAPHNLVEISNYIRVIANIHRLCQSPSLAFTLGEHLTLGDLGILGYCVMSCDHTARATRIWHQYNPLFFGNLIKVVYEQTGGQIRLTHVPTAGIREDLLQFLIEEKICYDVALQRLIGLAAFPISQLSLTYKQPAHVQHYRDLLGCTIEFSAARNSMLLSDNAFALPLHGGDAETHEHCMKLLDQVFVSISSDAGMARRVRAILHANLARNPGVEEVAAALNCSGRTLNRTLAKEGLNYRALSTELRLETIKNLLATTHLDAKELALLAGFSDARALRRFFKAQTRQTLKQFRANAMLS